MKFLSYLKWVYLGWRNKRAERKEDEYWGKLYGLMQAHPELYEEFLRRNNEARRT